MTTATLEKRVRVLEAEIKLIKSVVVRPHITIAKSKKKLPRWLQASLAEADKGKLSGPFNSTKELMAHLRK